MHSRKVVVVHDFLEVLEELVRYFAGSDYLVFCTTDPLAAVDLINRYAPHVLLTRGEFGWNKLPSETLARMLKLRRAEAAVVMVGSTESELADCSADAVVLLPISPAALLDTIDLAIRKAHPPAPPI